MEREIRDLIWQMSSANPLGGAPRIHGELLKLGIEVSQATVAKFVVRRRGTPSENWRTFLRNHFEGIAATDMFVVASASFRLLYVMNILAHDRRKVVRTAVTPPRVSGSHRHLQRAPSAPRPVFVRRDYYQHTRTHLSLDKDCPDPRPIMRRRIGKVIAVPQVGGLHHRYERLAA